MDNLLIKHLNYFNIFEGLTQPLSNVSLKSITRKYIPINNFILFMKSYYSKFYSTHIIQASLLVNNFKQ